jgi:hypothetical protein
MSDQFSKYVMNLKKLVDKQEYVDAIAIAEKCLAMEEGKESWLINTTYAYCLLETGSIAKSQTLFTHALDHLTEGIPPPNVTKVQKTLSDLYQRMGSWAQYADISQKLYIKAIEKGNIERSNTLAILICTAYLKTAAVSSFELSADLIRKHYDLSTCLREYSTLVGANDPKKKKGQRDTFSGRLAATESVGLAMIQRFKGGSENQAAEYVRQGLDLLGAAALRARNVKRQKEKERERCVGAPSSGAKRASLGVLKTEVTKTQDKSDGEQPAVLTPSPIVEESGILGDGETELISLLSLYLLQFELQLPRREAEDLASPYPSEGTAYVMLSWVQGLMKSRNSSTSDNFFLTSAVPKIGNWVRSLADFSSPSSRQLAGLLAQLTRESYFYPSPLEELSSQVHQKLEQDEKQQVQVDFLDGYASSCLLSPSMSALRCGQRAWAALVAEANLPTADLVSTQRAAFEYTDNKANNGADTRERSVVACLAVAATGAGLDSFKFLSPIDSAKLTLVAATQVLTFAEVVGPAGSRQGLISTTVLARLLQAAQTGGVGVGARVAMACTAESLCHFLCKPWKERDAELRQLVIFVGSLASFASQNIGICTGDQEALAEVTAASAGLVRVTGPAAPLVGILCLRVLLAIKHACPGGIDEAASAVLESAEEVADASSAGALTVLRAEVAWASLLRETQFLPLSSDAGPLSTASLVGSAKDSAPSENRAYVHQQSSPFPPLMRDASVPAIAAGQAVAVIKSCLSQIQRDESRAPVRARLLFLLGSACWLAGGSLRFSNLSSTIYHLSSITMYFQTDFDITRRKPFDCE